MDELLKDFPVVIDLPIAWGDMDAFNHVNNVVFFRYFESARIAYFGKIKLMEFKEATGIGPILASTQCHFKVPLVYPDQIQVGAKVEVLEKDGFSMRFAVVSRRLNKAAAVGDAKIVMYDYRISRKVSIPSEIRNAIAKLEKMPGEGPIL
jgi:acyl-CoA thioester hydrolase